MFTAHNVNAGARDANDSWFNRATLKFQYRRCNHIFLHTEKMKAELVAGYGISESKASVIPFGINSTVPNTALTTAQARQQLGLDESEKVLLFFGNIAAYKGVEFLVDAFIEVAQREENHRLIIAGRPKGSEAYWAGVLAKINTSPVRKKIILKIEFVPDAETEIYFKAADALVLPYTHVFQSGVLFLGYNFGLPVLAADVGSLRDEIIEGRTGFVFREKDAVALAKAIEAYFASDLFKNLEQRRQEIKAFANDRYSWTKVATITKQVYTKLLEN